MVNKIKSHGDHKHSDCQTLCNTKQPKKPAYSQTCIQICIWYIYIPARVVPYEGWAQIVRSMCVCVCIYIYIYIYIYICICICTHTHTHIICTHTQTHKYWYIVSTPCECQRIVDPDESRFRAQTKWYSIEIPPWDEHICHTHIDKVVTHECMCVCVCVCRLCVYLHTCVHTCIHAYMHTKPDDTNTQIKRHACMLTVCVYIYIIYRWIKYMYICM
jgi:hypothetical protein